MDELPAQTGLRILLLEDEPSDAELAEEALREAGLAFSAERVDTRDAFVRALEEFKPDIVLSDYKLPAFDGGAALGIVLQQHPEIPVVIVSGAIGEEKAVELLKLGAKDYVLKDKLARLGPAVQRALTEEQAARARRAAEAALQQSEADLRALVEHSPVAMLVGVGLEPDEKIVMMNRKFTELFGYTLEDIPDLRHWWPLAYPDEAYRNKLMADWETRARGAIERDGNVEPLEVAVACKDGSIRYVRISPISIGNRYVVTFEDLTGRRLAEDRVRQLSRLYATLSQCNQAIVHCTSEGILFPRICYNAVEHGGFKMAWIGLVDGPDKMVKPVAAFGDGTEYLNGILISADAASPYGNGPTGTCIRENRPFWCQDFRGDPATLPWRDRAMRFGWRASAALPLRKNGAAVGALTLYSGEAGAFDEAARNLLTELADDIGFAMENYAREAQREAAEKQLREQELRFRTLADSGKALIWTSGTDKLCDYFNRPWMEFTGRPLEALLGNGWAADVHPDDLEHCIAIYTGAFDRREPFNMAYRLRRRDGEYRWMHDDGCPRYNADGEFIGYIGYVLDITALKRAELKLAEREQHFRAVAESANDAIITIDGRGNVVDWNPAAERMFGRTRDEMSGRPLTALIPERFREPHDAGLARVASGGAPRAIGKTLELAGLRGDGSEFPLELSLAQWESAEGKFFTAIVRDIGERKRAETLINTQFAEILHAKAEWQQVFDGISSPIFLHDEGFRITRANRAYTGLAGKPFEEIIGKPYYTVFPVTGAPLACCMRAMEKNAETEEEEEFSSGSAIFRMRTFTLRGNDNVYRCSVHILEDITERRRIAEQQALDYLYAKELNVQLNEANQQLKQTQNQLLQSEKMAAIGLLAAGVAHEINNPVGYVNSNLGTLEKYLASILAILDKYEAAEALLGGDAPLLDELRRLKEKTDLDYIRKDLKALLAESHHGLERVKKIVLDLKNFSRTGSEEQWAMADLHTVLESTLNVVWNELKYKCEVFREYGELPQIECLSAQLDQVFMNLLLNAAQAIEAHGKITIRTGQENDGVWVEIADTGKGIPPEHLPHLFEPFFTTKPIGKGTGLGLAVSYNIVAKHHGKIETHSEVGKGTVFRVWLPVRQPAIDGMAPH